MYIGGDIGFNKTFSKQTQSLLHFLLISGQNFWNFSFRNRLTVSLALISSLNLNIMHPSNDKLLQKETLQPSFL